MLEALAREAGLTPEEAFDTTWAYVYPDDETLGRAMVAPAGIAELVGASREDALRAPIIEGLAPYRADAGSYRLRNQYHFLIARA